MRTLYFWIIGTLLIAPFVVVLGVSVGASSNIAFPPESLSIIWYRELLTEPEWLAAIGRSLLIAVVAGLIATVLALAIHYVLWRTKTGFAKATFALGLGPFLLPPIILALGASLFWAQVGWYGRMEATIISHGVFFVTLPLVIIARGFAALTDEVVEAAQMMGATPAQVFHMIRRQHLRPVRRPLVVMTPKSLLRHPLAVSEMDDLADLGFQNAIGEIDDLNPKKVKRVVFCSGKVYYDLLKERREREQEDVAIIRIEQLYPFPAEEVAEIMKDYQHVKDFVWCQEEPQNQGAWYSSQHHIRRALQNHVAELHLKYAGRAASAAAAAGNMGLHQAQQDALVSLALNGEFAEIETIQARS